MRMRQLLGVGFAVLLAAGSASLEARAQAPEKKDVKLGVGGATSLYYLPLALTEKLGFFKEQGLNVEVSDFKGGSQSLTALIGGSADVVTGAYEHTIRMQVKGQEIQAVIELGRYPGISLAVRKDRADKIKSAADLKGAKIGVTAPGSSTNMMVWYLMAKAGLKPDDASYVGVGTGGSAVGAIMKGEIDAISNIDPVMTKLENEGQVSPRRDAHHGRHQARCSRPDAGRCALTSSATSSRKNPNTVRHWSTPSTRPKWMEKATPEAIADAVPEEFWLGDKASLRRGGEGFLDDLLSRDGIVSADEASGARSISCASSTRRSPTPRSTPPRPGTTASSEGGGIR